MLMALSSLPMSASSVAGMTDVVWLARSSLSALFVEACGGAHHSFMTAVHVDLSRWLCIFAVLEKLSVHEHALEFRSVSC